MRRDLLHVTEADIRQLPGLIIQTQLILKEADTAFFGIQTTVHHHKMRSRQNQPQAVGCHHQRVAETVWTTIQVDTQIVQIWLRCDTQQRHHNEHILTLATQGLKRLSGEIQDDGFQQIHACCACIRVDCDRVSALRPDQSHTIRRPGSSGDGKSQVKIGESELDILTCPRKLTAQRRSGSISQMVIQ